MVSILHWLNYQFPVYANLVFVLVFVLALIQKNFNRVVDPLSRMLAFVCRWWAPSKFDPVKSPMLFFETDQPIIPPLPPDVGLDMVLKHMVWHWIFVSLTESFHRKSWAYDELMCGRSQFDCEVSHGCTVSHVVFVICWQIQYVEKTARPGLIKLFRTQSPRHFEGGDWDQGGSCKRLQPLSSEQVSHI